MNTVKKPVSKKYFILAAVALVLIISLVGAILIGSAERSGSISDELKDAVLHEEKKINLFGWAVNPAAISAMIVTGDTHKDICSTPFQGCPRQVPAVHREPCVLL